MLTAVHWSEVWYGWRLPDADASGHPLRKGEISVKPVRCRPDCPAIGADGVTHLAVYCREDRCRDVTYPPGHVGDLPDQAREGPSS